MRGDESDLHAGTTAVSHVFPACAGMNPLGYRKTSDTIAGFPRARGDESWLAGYIAKQGQGFPSASGDESMKIDWLRRNSEVPRARGDESSGRRVVWLGHDLQVPDTALVDDVPGKVVQDRQHGLDRL